MVQYFAQDRHMCPDCGTRMQWQWVDPPETGWDECPRCHSQWRLNQAGELRPRSEIKVRIIGAAPGTAPAD